MRSRTQTSPRAEACCQARDKKIKTTHPGSHDARRFHLPFVEGQAVADAVCAALEMAAIRCGWLRVMCSPVVRLRRDHRAIHRSKAMVLIFSVDSNSSEQILRELQLAANRIGPCSVSYRGLGS